MMTSMTATMTAAVMSATMVTMMTMMMVSSTITTTKRVGHLLFMYSTPSLFTLLSLSSPSFFASLARTPYSILFLLAAPPLFSQFTLTLCFYCTLFCFTLTPDSVPFLLRFPYYLIFTIPSFLVDGILLLLRFGLNSGIFISLRNEWLL